MPDFSSGLVGLILGAFLGLLLSVLLEDALKSRMQRNYRRIRLRMRRSESPQFQECFQLGSLLHTDVVVLEGDGTSVIAEERVRLVVDSRFVDVPAEVAEWRREIQLQQEKKRKSGEVFQWSGPRYAISGFRCAREGVDELPSIAFSLQFSDYYTFLAAQQLDRTLTDGQTLRSKHLSSQDIGLAPPFLSSSLGVAISVITADGFIVFSQRSADVGPEPLSWNVSANEGLSRTLDSQGRGTPNLHRVAERGLCEEMSLSASEFSLEMLAVALDRKNNHWGVLFVAELKDITGEQLLGRMSRGTPDRFEHANHDLVKFTVRNVIEYLVRIDRRYAWAPMAPALAHLALVKEYGRSRVESDSARVISGIERQKSSPWRRCPPHTSSSR
jgi:hypothetical protein